MRENILLRAMESPARCLKNIFFTCLLIVIGGCAVGPDFHAPSAPGVKKYTEEPLPAQTASAPGIGGETQRFAEGLDIPAQWWNLFHSEELDGIIRRALADSPTLAAAEASLIQARENLNSRAGKIDYPSVDANLSASRQRVTGASTGLSDSLAGTYKLFNASVNVSYTLDIFGGGRRELESLRAQVDFQQFQLEGAHLTLTSNIVTAAVKEASLRARIRAYGEIIASQTKQLEMVERQSVIGGASQVDVLAQQTQLAQTRALLPPLESELAANRHLLAVLSGQFPGDAVVPEFRIEGFQLPTELPVSLPSMLARNRPDILASEALLHAASANVGVATANLYPQITLTAAGGANALRVEDLFLPGTTMWSIGAGLMQPIFHGGELTAKRRAAIAAFEQARAQYQETVLKAFQEVADVLKALDADARTLRAQAETEAIARETLNLTEKQFQYGATNYLTLLNAQRQYRLALIGLVQVQAVRFADTAALFQALGGSWREEKTSQ